MCQAHSTFTRFTRYLPFNAEVAFPFLAPPHASVPRLSHLPLRSLWHPFFVLVPRARLLPSLGPLCPCQFLVLSSVPLPSPARSALCLLLPLSAPLLVLSAFCSSLVHSTPSTSSFRIPHVACAISQPDSHLISSMVLVLCPFPVRASLVCWWLDLFVVGECSIDQVHPL